MLLTVKGNQKTLLRQIRCQFQCKRQIPFTAMAQSKKHGRDTLWETRAKEAPEHIKENWPGVSWIIEMISTTVTRRGHQPPQANYFLTSLRTKPEALLRLIRQRWSIENEWHWPRDTQLHEDAHRYANRKGAPLFAFLRTVVMNLLRAIHRKMLIAGQRLDLRRAHQLLRKAANDLVIEQPLTVLGKGGGMPDRNVGAQAHKPAVQQVVVQLLQQQPLGADSVERLQ